MVVMKVLLMTMEPVIGHGSVKLNTTFFNFRGASSFRNTPSVQARARWRSTSEPDGTVIISYNFAEMLDIHGFLSDRRK